MKRRGFLGLLSGAAAGLVLGVKAGLPENLLPAAVKVNETLDLANVVLAPNPEWFDAPYEDIVVFSRHMFDLLPEDARKELYAGVNRQPGLGGCVIERGHVRDAYDMSDYAGPRYQDEGGEWPRYKEDEGGEWIEIPRFHAVDGDGRPLDAEEFGQWRDWLRERALELEPVLKEGGPRWHA